MVPSDSCLILHTKGLNLMLHFNVRIKSKTGNEKKERELKRKKITISKREAVYISVRLVRSYVISQPSHGHWYFSIVKSSTSFRIQ